ncbi:MAG: PAS domain-containing protein [Kiloniellaceae bacterium]
MFDPVDIKDPRLRDLYNYWESKKRGDRLPARADIDPVEIPGLLRNVALVRVIGDAEDFEIVLAGSRIEEVHGRSLKGVSISTLREKLETSPAIRQYAEVVRHAEPRYREGDLKIFGKEHWWSHRLLLPLSSDGKRVDMMLAGVFFAPASQPGQLG